MLPTMNRIDQRLGRGVDSRQLATILVVAVGLLSLGPTDSFLSAPLSMSGGVGLRRRAVDATRSPHAWSGVPREAGACCGRGSKSRLCGVAEEQEVESVVQPTKEVANNDMNPFVVIPRRDPREWFDSVRAGAAPRPEALSELSK